MFTTNVLFSHSMSIRCGSGQFGDVFKGVWETPYGPRNVAMKMLKPGAKKNEKVKFLQEAAIMAQFKHPHIVELFGAVTVEEPVSKYFSIFCHHPFHSLIFPFMLQEHAAFGVFA